jgi:putative methylase
MLCKRKELEKFISNISPHPKPKLSIEQYTTPAFIASTLLCTAAYTFGDIQDKSVCDLGCGTGRLAMGASYLGANLVVGVDIDCVAILAARKKAVELGLHIDWVMGDIENLAGNFDTALENPPFGVRKHGADIRFLRKALSIADVTYSIHKSSLGSRSFIGNVVNRAEGKITNIVESILEIPHQFEFHRKPVYKVKVDIYRISKRR